MLQSEREYIKAIFGYNNRVAIKRELDLAGYKNKVGRNFSLQTISGILSGKAENLEVETAILGFAIAEEAKREKLKEFREEFNNRTKK